jgi:hypothetical protein
MSFHKPRVLVCLFQMHSDRGLIYNKIRGFHIKFIGFNEFGNYFPMVEPMDLAAARTPGMATCCRHVVRRALWGLGAHRRRPGRKWTMKWSSEELTGA